MRGKRCAMDFRCEWGRITPAYAGKTFSLPSSSGRFQDHPRVCGENPVLREARDEIDGSPPRMRGKRKMDGRSGAEERITPAYAGKTSMPCSTARFISDHPRVCGENGKNIPTLTLTAGSPPRMRGKRRNDGFAQFLTGITPAYAGKTSWHTEQRRCYSDHPRVCGENGYIPARCGIREGSPPRMRGKPDSTHMPCLILRITPAYAGKTHSLPHSCGITADHPRVCGENLKHCSGKRTLSGSPPRMRGKHCGIGYDILLSRITPAYAGKTAGGNITTTAASDHPRVCGENSCSTVTAVAPPGSPPRMRGKP